MAHLRSDWLDLHSHLPMLSIVLRVDCLFATSLDEFSNSTVHADFPLH